MTKPKLRGPAPSSGKHIPAATTRIESPEQQPPVFSLRYLQPGYSLADCNREEKAAFADTLHKLSQMTWAEINVSSRHGRGYERIPRTQIKAPVPPHVTEDVNLLAFRFCGLAPMVGYRDGAIFHVLWLDRAFTLYHH